MEPFIFFNLAAAIVSVLFVWVLSLLKLDAGIAYIFWGLGFILVAWVTFFLSQGDGLRRFIVVAMTSLWGLRLSIHLLPEPTFTMPKKLSELINYLPEKVNR